MAIVLFDKKDRKKLYPLNNCCATADLRCGIFNAMERWAFVSGEKILVHTSSYLQQLYGPVHEGLHIWVDASVLPDQILITTVLSLSVNEAIVDENGIVAIMTNIPATEFDETIVITNSRKKLIKPVHRLEYPWNFFLYNDAAIRNDFELITAQKTTLALPEQNNYINPSQIFMEEGAEVLFSTINAATGPVYIGKDAMIMEGSIIRGPFAMCTDARLKMGAKVYGATTLGPGGVCGGEVKNVVLQAFSNKAHDGYLGDSVIGRWCNLGAGTTCSNLKNNAGIVRMWNAFEQAFADVDVKCGLIMGDYSKTAINSSLNTGTIIGTCCNVFGEGLLPRLIPDFEWGVNATGKYELHKAISDISNWKKMKGHTLDQPEINVLKHIFGHIETSPS